MAEKIYSAEEVRKRMESLPPEIKTLLYSEEMYNIVKKIGEKFKLHIDQIGLLEAEVGQVMLGFIESKALPQELSDALQIGKAQADAIAHEINEQLFIKIRAAMQKADSTAMSTPVPPPPPAIPKASTLPVITNVAPKPPAPPPPLATTLPKAPVSVPVITPSAPPAVISPISAPVTPKAVGPADIALTQKTVSAPKPVVPAAPSTPPPATTPTPPSTKTEPPKPGPNYKATDPYREPTE